MLMIDKKWMGVVVTILLALAFPANAQTRSPQQQPAGPIRKVEEPSTSASKKQRPSVNTPEDDTEVIRVDTNLVNTLFTAIDKDGHFVTSLGSADVSIFENNFAQPISLFERETDRPLTLAILIDTSESQRGVLADEKNAARAFVDSVIRPRKVNGDRAAIISFTGAPKLEQELTNNQKQLQQGIERVRIELSAENARRLANGDDPLPKEEDPSGYTSIWDAMWMAIDDILLKDTGNTRRAIVLLSDGDDTSSTIKKQDVIDLAIKSDVVIYSIGIRDRDFPEGKLDTGSLKKVSDRSGGRAFFPQNKAELQLAFAQIDQELRSQYLIAYSPTNANRDGSYRQIRIDVVNPELKKSKVRLLYRGGYYARRIDK
jgi:VWFA-related protein